MRYMMLVYTREDVGLSPEEMEQVAATHRSLIEQTTQLGILQGAEPLAPTSTAKRCDIKMAP